MAEKQNVNNVISKRIIAFVKKNPILYEPSGGYGKNLRLKDQTWMDLVPQLGLSLNTIKYKWRNIRDSYSRHLKATASGERDKQSLRYRNWLWSRHMEFMRPYVNLAPGAALTLPRPRVPNTTEDVEDDEETEKKPETITDNQDEEESEEDTRTIPQIIKGENRIEKRRFQRITLPKPPPQRPVQRQSLDGIDHIFLGYAKTVKKLSPRRQVMVKMEIAKVMMQAEMEELQGEQTTNPLDLEETTDSNSMMTPLLNGVVCKQQIESEDESYNEML